MENAPVITLNGFSPYPGVEAEIWERFQKWSYEVYAPIMMKYPGRTGIYSYNMIKETPLYPYFISMHHYESLTAQQHTYSNQDQLAIQADNLSWRSRNVMEGIWSSVYQLERSFRNELSTAVIKPDTRIQNAPIMHLEAYRLTPEDQGKYNKWFTDYGMNIFIPLYLKQAGVKGYDYFKFLGERVGSNPREPDYPAYLSVIYFENLEAFIKYEKCPELITYQKTLRNTFSRGINYWWYVEYQLISSQRK
jgi:hypothetical protein